MTTKELEKRIETIEARNYKVEMDKEWEGSATRRVILFTLTYLSISLYFLAINIQKPFLSAVVPSVGFWLSTLTIPFFRKLWEKHIRR